MLLEEEGLKNDRLLVWFLLDCMNEVCNFFMSYVYLCLKKMVKRKVIDRCNDLIYYFFLYLVLKFL